MTTETTLREPPRASGAEGENGHLDEFSRGPIGLNGDAVVDLAVKYCPTHALSIEED